VPVTAYRPVTTYAYSPTTSYAYSPVVSYSPVVAYSPAVTYATPVNAYYYGAPVVSTKVYYPGQPIRNFFRAITP
jgi:hypothetical protein